MQRSIDSSVDYKSGQILYIEHQGMRLYAEVIQAVSDRNLCWVRPLALVKSSGCSIPPGNSAAIHLLQQSSSYTGTETVDLHDLRQGVDLVCPQSLFRIALDTEVVPILAELHRLKPQPDSGLGENGSAHELLREFISQLWQSNPKLFN